ncbi:MAG: hypothetical protein SCK28_09385 [Bacillota bacterium]|nr:hypothetical protein [Bacillota bacterium]
MYHDRENYHLGTWGFPSLGWWVLHAVGISAIYYLGKKSGNCCEEEEE